MARLSRPLDFLVVADHSDNLGLFDLIFAQDPSIMTDPEGNRIATMVANGGDEAEAAALELIDSYSRGEAISPALAIEAGSKAFRSVWQRQIEAAEEAYEPGLFTSLIGYLKSHRYIGIAKGNIYDTIWIV